MICIAWIDYDGTTIDKTQVEYRNGVLQHKLLSGLPRAKAVNYSSRESAQMWRRAKDYAKTMEADHAVVIVCKAQELSEAKAEALARHAKGGTL